MIDHLDHIVLTTTDEAACLRFYVDGLGMTLESFGQGRKALRFGDQKINLHVKGHEFEPKAHLPVPGALDLCFIASVPLDEVVKRLAARGLSIIEGPVARTGAVSGRRVFSLHKVQSVCGNQKNSMWSSWRARSVNESTISSKRAGRSTARSRNAGTHWSVTVVMMPRAPRPSRAAANRSGRTSAEHSTTEPSL